MAELSVSESFQDLQMNIQRPQDLVAEAAQTYADGDPAGASLVLGLKRYLPRAIEEGIGKTMALIEAVDGVTGQDWIDRHSSQGPGSRDLDRR